MLLGAGFLAGWLGSEVTETVLHLTAAAIGGWTFVPGTLKALRRKRIGVDTLMTIAGALVLGQFGEAAMLAFLFSISEVLEDYSLSRTRRGLRALLALVPYTVTVLRAGREAVIAPAELRAGDRILARAGDQIAGIASPSGHERWPFPNDARGRGSLAPHLKPTKRLRLLRLATSWPRRRGEGAAGARFAEVVDGLVSVTGKGTSGLR
ncbi:hypothetical protein AB0N89_36110 [Amycolatopsis sp. NPDC089917]|uniref:hypothetical protein n=1 Tax=Amycolatopsis sp. NPDC089917 TaxID=3155187 RepID=UPI0034369D8C